MRRPFAMVLLLWSHWALLRDSASAADAPTVRFETDVQPILTARCAKCHGNGDAEAGLKLVGLAEASARLESGARAIIPGKPDESELLRRVTSKDDSLRMPPEGPALSTEQVDALRRWIAAGAEWPSHWAYRPLVRPAVPSPAGELSTTWARTPVDRFVLQGLVDRKLTPSPPADRRTLLRRVTLDLTGLPPTPDEFDAFLADVSPDAFERVVDRLLASPSYGERWARHWMDVVHYAETHGHDQDRPRENAWPYRDWLIRSLNEDKPYSRFVEEQIAGDVLFPDDPQAIAATGLLATGAWDESSLMSIQENTLDREIARYIDRDDIVTTVMSTFVSSTVHCARCHAHKFDPISQREYYALQAVFSSIDKADRPYDPDPAVANRRRDLTARIAGVPDLKQRRDASLLAPELTAEVAAWEKAVRASASLWQTLDPAEFTSSGGATLTKLDDGSVLSGGTKPEKDTVTIVAHTPLKTVTGLRLEVLTDERLPHKGPGRQDNGNLHLNELVVHLAPRDNPAAKQKATLIAPTADFNQQGWTIAHALDGNPATAWGIHPAVGKPHFAIFELKDPIRSDDGLTVTVDLQQTHGGGHLIGRARLLATDAAPPLPPEAEPLPAPIAAVVATPAEQRDQAQRAELAAFVLEAKLKRELEALPKPQFVYSGSNQFTANGSFRPALTPRPIHLLGRGEITKKGDEVGPGTLDCVPALPGDLGVKTTSTDAERRIALAKWLSDRRNVLTWRSIANRVWQYHFGRGLVDTPSDFGRMGSSPTHPELLDWLAIELIADCGLRIADSDGQNQPPPQNSSNPQSEIHNPQSLKRLHRLIVTSAAYQQSSRHDAAAAAIDGDNRYLWRANRQRLDAESLRDAALVLGGAIDRRMGGSSAKQFVQTAGLHVTPDVNYEAFPVDDPANYRRSVYRFIFRTLPDPFMDALDCPDSSQLTPRRTESVTALQALALWNDKFMVRQTERIAGRIVRPDGDKPQEAAAAYRLILGRSPSSGENEALAAYATKHGWPNAVRVLLNSNEFVFVD